MSKVGGTICSHFYLAGAIFHNREKGAGEIKGALKDNEEKKKWIKKRMWIMSRELCPNREASPMVSIFIVPFLFLNTQYNVQYSEYVETTVVFIFRMRMISCSLSWALIRILVMSYMNPIYDNKHL